MNQEEPIIKFKGKSKFMFEDGPGELDQILNGAIKEEMARRGITSLTAQEVALIKAEITRKMLLLSGMPEEEIAAMQQEADETAERLVKDREDFISKFDVIKKDPEEITSKPYLLKGLITILDIYKDAEGVKFSVDKEGNLKIIFIQDQEEKTIGGLLELNQATPGRGQ